jgi:heat-inducible transcriptional repressor
MVEQSLPELTSRQEQILSLLIQSYSDQPEPVSSKHLAEQYGLGFSSATIRNEMAVLEDLGYVYAPHTSAGRIPTESGYRYFVKRLIKVNDLTLSEQKYITERFQSLQMATEQWMRVAASVLSRMVRTASIVTPPIAETSRFKHIELISIQGRLVLLVVVLHGGTVHQRMLTLADPVPQPTLSEAATRLNSLCLDLYADEIRMKSTKLDVLAHEIAQLVADVMDRADSNQVRVIYREGLSEIIGAFPDGEGAQQAVRLFEERAFLNMILSDFLNDGVQVIVAGENRWDELSQLSMVLSRYGVPGQMTGAVGVLGPTHINYGRAIGAVRYVSTLMTNMLVDLYQGGTSDSGQSEGEYPA